MFIISSMFSQTNIFVVMVYNTLYYKSSFYNPANVRLWIHLHDSNYFPPSSLEGSHYYFLPHKSYLVTSIITTAKTNKKRCTILHKKTEQKQCDNFLGFYHLSLIAAVIKQRTHSIHPGFSPEIFNLFQTFLLLLVVCWYNGHEQSNYFPRVFACEKLLW